MFPVKIASASSRVCSLIILLSFIVASKGLSAQTNEPCFNPAALKNICMMVESRIEDSNPQGKYIYAYQRKIMEAACVDFAKDSEEVIAQKIRKMWLKFEDRLVCTSVMFDTSEGNLIKLAVSNRFDMFINDVTKWGVNLNRVDQVDRLTVLDYVQKQLERNKGKAIEGRLQKYYNQIRAAGGKFASEL